jgi:hypothetical protein
MQKLSVASSTCTVEENGATMRHARTTLCSPIEPRRCLLGSRQRKTRLRHRKRAGAKFIWDHRMTGPEGGRFSGGRPRFGAVCATNLRLQGCSCFMANRIFLQAPVSERAHLRAAPVGLDVGRAVSAMPLQ